MGIEESEIPDIIDACTSIVRWIKDNGNINSILQSVNHLEYFLRMNTFQKRKTIYRATVKARIPSGKDIVEYYNTHYEKGELKSWSESMDGVKYFIASGQNVNIVLVADVPLDNIIISVMDFYDFLNYMYNEFPNFYEFEKMARDIVSFIDEQEVIVYMDNKVKITEVIPIYEIYDY